MATKKKIRKAPVATHAAVSTPRPFLMDGEVLVLRTCKPAMRSPSPDANGFVWPESGFAEAKDWTAHPSCGGGLHGWVWGTGDTVYSGGYFAADAKWLVVRVQKTDGFVELEGKVKFRRGDVVLVGTRDEATALIAKHAPAGTKINWHTSTSGTRGTSTSGDGGTSTSGYGGTSTSGTRGTCKAGEDGLLVFQWYDVKAEKYRKAYGAIDGERLLPNVKYRCDETGQIVPVEQPKPAEVAPVQVPA
jgi:hypothetical protein